MLALILGVSLPAIAADLVIDGTSQTLDGTQSYDSVQIINGGAFGSPRINWDAHEDVVRNHNNQALQFDQPCAALLKDLKQRGMLHDTLVIWGGEFGRTPHAKKADGRDHNSSGFSFWMAGGGVKGGMRYGQTDDYGFTAVDGRMHIHDWHATVLHLLGLNHKKLTFNYAGRDFRLTDVHGNVAKEILA